MVFKDQLNRNIKFDGKYTKIVSLVPSQTELLVHLGLSDCIIGVTKFCIHPSNIKKNKVIVGGTKNVNFDLIKELNPDIILCNKEENTKEIVEELAKSYVVHVSNVFTITDALVLIVQYGKLFQKELEAQSLIDKIKYEQEKFSVLTKDWIPKKVAYFIWRKPWMVAGKDTFINHLLGLNKFENVFGQLSRYPEIQDFTTIEIESADLILLSSEPFPFSEKHIKEIQQLVSNRTQIILVDGEMFSWYGSRLLQSFDYFYQIFRTK